MKRRATGIPFQPDSFQCLAVRPSSPFPLSYLYLCRWHHHPQQSPYISTGTTPPSGGCNITGRLGVHLGPFSQCSKSILMCFTLKMLPSLPTLILCRQAIPYAMAHTFLGLRLDAPCLSWAKPVEQFCRLLVYAGVPIKTCSYITTMPPSEPNSCMAAGYMVLQPSPP